VCHVEARLVTNDDACWRDRARDLDTRASMIAARLRSVLRAELVDWIRHEVDQVLEKPLRAAKLPLLHDAAIPFPLGNHRARFVVATKAALNKLNNSAGS